MDEKFKSRKFILASCSLAVASVGIAAGWLSGGEWVAAVSFILGLYGTANVSQRAVTRGNERD